MISSLKASETPGGFESRSSIYLGILDCASTRFDYQGAVALLGEAERERLASITRERRRAEYAAGRMIAKTVVAWALGLAAEEVELGGPEGKPEGPLGLSIGIAHSGGVAICAASTARLGIDIERVERDRDFEGIAEAVFDEAELASIGGRPRASRMRRFYALWTMKEARAKLDGRGLSALAEGPSIVLGPRGPSIVLGPRGPSTGLGFICLGIGPRLVASLALEAGVGAPELRFHPGLSPDRGLRLRLLYSTFPASPLSARRGRRAPSRS
jgi:phosphopantetheinyl transferase